VDARSYQRLTRYAAFTAVHAVVVLVLAWRGPDLADAGTVVLAGASLPLAWAWGSFQADVALNPLLDERERSRWRIVLACVPWSIAIYWLREVRGRRLRG
jgi:hypothetical protein